MTDSDEEEEEGVLDLQIRTMRLEADDVLSIELVDPEGGWLPEWTPGAHIDLGMPDEIRQYSLCGDPADRTRYLVAVLREPDSRGGSAYLHNQARPGEIIEVGGPRNHFQLSPAKDYLFIAGGIGITPILPMIRHAEQEQIPWRLMYGGRRRSSMAFTRELARYGDRVLLQAEDEAGRLDAPAFLADPHEGTKVFCCGPTGLIEAVESGCQDWPTGALNIERFVAKDLSDLESKPVHVTCAQSGLEVDVPASRSILEALEDVGLNIANACREGVCGSCEVRVLSGVPAHRDSYRNADELDDTSSLATCVSRACTSELVLDI